LVRRILCAAAINILSNPPALLRKAARGGSSAAQPRWQHNYGRRTARSQPAKSLTFSAGKQYTYLGARSKLSSHTAPAQPTTKR